MILFNSLAYTLAVVNSYIWNSRLTFRQEAFHHLREKIHFSIQAAISLLISNGVFLQLENWLLPLHLSAGYIHNGAKLISMAFSATASFIFMKLYVFKGEMKGTKEKGGWLAKASERR